MAQKKTKDQNCNVDDECTNYGCSAVNQSTNYCKDDCVHILCNCDEETQCREFDFSGMDNACSIDYAGRIRYILGKDATNTLLSTAEYVFDLIACETYGKDEEDDSNCMCGKNKTDTCTSTSDCNTLEKCCGDDSKKSPGDCSSTKDCTKFKQCCENLDEKSDNKKQQSSKGSKSESGKPRDDCKPACPNATSKTESGNKNKQNEKKSNQKSNEKSDDKSNKKSNEKSDDKSHQKSSKSNEKTDSRSNENTDTDESKKATSDCAPDCPNAQEEEKENKQQSKDKPQGCSDEQPDSCPYRKKQEPKKEDKCDENCPNKDKDESNKKQEQSDKQNKQEGSNKQQGQSNKQQSNKKQGQKDEDDSKNKNKSKNKNEDKNKEKTDNESRICSLKLRSCEPSIIEASKPCTLSTCKQLARRIYPSGSSRNTSACEVSSITDQVAEPARAVSFDKATGRISRNPSRSLEVRRDSKISRGPVKSKSKLENDSEEFVDIMDIVCYKSLECFHCSKSVSCALICCKCKCKPIKLKSVACSNLNIRTESHTIKGDTKENCFKSSIKRLKYIIGTIKLALCDPHLQHHKSCNVAMSRKVHKCDLVKCKKKQENKM